MKYAVAVICLLLSACTPTTQPYREKADPHANIVIGDHTLLTADERILPLRSWLPKTKPKAVIIALHGFNDYNNAFESTGTFFMAHDVAVFAYDQRGFGHTPGTGIWAGERNLTRDVAECVKQVSRRYPGTPVYVLGESMGGAVAISALADPEFPKVRGMILLAPAVWGQETMNWLFRSTLWTAAHTMPAHEMTGSDLKILASNNIPMLRRLSYDPLVIKSTRVDAVYGMVQLMDSAYAKVPDIKTPTLLLYGGQDQVIPSEPIEKAVERFTIPVQFAYYPDSYHMLTRDIQGEEVMRDILSWVLHPDKPLPSGNSAVFGPKS